MKKIAVGSKNPVKIECVRQAFEAVWPNEEWEVVGVPATSGVPDQPMSLEDGIRGATNRAKGALAVVDADYGVGLEGVLERFDEQWIDSGWIVIIDKEGVRGVGSTIRMVVPRAIMKLIDEGLELGLAIDEVFKTENAKQAEGFFGLMTHGAITRTHAYRDGVIAALTTFTHPDLH